VIAYDRQQSLLTYHNLCDHCEMLRAVSYCHRVSYDQPQNDVILI
jgi:hypothetical protein